MTTTRCSRAAVPAYYLWRTIEMWQSALHQRRRRLDDADLMTPISRSHSVAQLPGATA